MQPSILSAVAMAAKSCLRAHQARTFPGRCCCSYSIVPLSLHGGTTCSSGLEAPMVMMVIYNLANHHKIALSVCRSVGRYSIHRHRFSTMTTCRYGQIWVYIRRGFPLAFRIKQLHELSLDHGIPIPKFRFLLLAG